VNAAGAPAATIYLIRHGEKPDDRVNGVDADGNIDVKSLTPRGWRRAGAWAVYFGKGGDPASPQRIYASNDEKEKVAKNDKDGSRSKRPIETVAELADKLGKTVIDKYLKGGEQDLVNAIRDLDGVALVCWQHEAIPEIAQRLAGPRPDIPAKWPDNRFDVVWRFTRTAKGAAWSFDQVCPQLLFGDLAESIA
jgi:broad specificity phosphatase PhoE